MGTSQSVSLTINDDPMISIAILTNSTRPSLAVAHGLGLAETLARQGADVTLHALARQGVRSFYRPVDLAVEVVLHPFPHVADESLVRATQRSISILADAVDLCLYDVIHTQDGVASAAVPGSIRTIMQLDEATLVELRKYSAQQRHGRPTRYMCASPAIAGQIRRILGETPMVIPSGVFGQRFGQAGGATIEAVSARNCWRMGLANPFVLALGGVAPDNATIELLEAVALAREVFPSLQLVIAGGYDQFKYRDYRISLDVRAAELGIQPKVLGPIQDDGLPSLVAACDIFVDFSKVEGFAAVGLEALAARRPLVCRDIPSRRDQFKDLARYGRDTQSLSRAFVRALTDLGERVEGGQQLAASYCWDNMATKLLGYYENIGLLPSSGLVL